VPGDVLRQVFLQLRLTNYENETVPNIGLTPYSKARVQNDRIGWKKDIWANLAKLPVAPSFRFVEPLLPHASAAALCRPSAALRGRSCA
jgi:hypothetical protein